MKDEMIKCKDCGAEFPFTVREQEFYAEKGFTKPIRCKACRDARKRERGNNRDRRSSNNSWREAA